MTNRYYYSSHAWLNSKARLAELKASGGKCRLCFRGEPDVRIEVHHRTYKRLGFELTSDLTTLCTDCHLGTHKMLSERKGGSK